MKDSVLDEERKTATDILPTHIPYILNQKMPALRRTQCDTYTRQGFEAN
jgi:hypothetical protein